MWEEEEASPLGLAALKGRNWQILKTSATKARALERLVETLKFNHLDSRE
uniref:Uncharacterized protein n=1 Tax=Sciurus vulgaris TaxID=55149 RepID=A0A8D2DGD8_SCIVU